MPLPDHQPHKSLLVLTSASLLAAVLGSVHGFSVFLVPLETAFGATRSSVSLTYSLALVALTISVLFGHRLYARWTPGVFVVGICGLAALGALVAAFAPSLAFVWFGYSLLFGAANGLGYGFALQFAAQSSAGREGTTMGIVTAAYAFGAATSPALFVHAMGFGGFQAAMLGLAIVLMAVSVICLVLLNKSKAAYKSQARQASAAGVPKTDVMLLWLGYGGGVACGLMAIGHAAGIATSLDYSGAIWIAPAVIAVSNLGGSLLAGRLADAVSSVGLLLGLPFLSAVGVTVLAITADVDLLLVCFAVIGFSYGGIIAAYPAVIAKMFGVLKSPPIYGRVFTAWGSAGLFAPWLAGRLFDWTGAYQLALLTAGFLGVVSLCAMTVYFMRKSRS
jgi:MFS transporter, OFA family, oxalate/formate antiporter